MDYKYNKKYFTSPTWPVPVGGCLIGLGCIPFFLMLMNIGRMWAFIAPAVACIGAGMVIILTFNGGKSNENTIKEQIEKSNRTFKDDAIEKLGLTDKQANAVPLHEPMIFGEYDFTDKEAGFYAKKGNDGKYRAAFYSTTAVIYTEAYLAVYNRTVGLCDEYTDVKTIKIPYLNMGKVFTEEKEKKLVVGKNTVTVKYYLLTFSDESGNSLTVSVKNDADIDRLVADVTAFSDRKKRDSKK